ncbi:MAG: GNAT family N-acetyltransferase [Sedimentibacter sp.]|uniref:GNAT family N-acetyltransferase n=1 Tax=Sedimentibacter sp. TaxID=1960295 RepID=UPI003158958E
MLNFRDIPVGEVSIIKGLWEKNRKYHEDISEYFGDLYSDLVFEDRMNPFSSFDREHIKITVVEDADMMLGYSISTFEEDEGCIHSLHVAEGVRGTGIGKSLMNSHISWLKKSGCKNISITVAVENKNTIQFYKKLGFKSNTLEMRLN